MERPPVLTQEDITNAGSRHLSKYALRAVHSEVPALFNTVSKKILSSQSLGLSTREAAQLLLGRRFNNEFDAWTALSYAQAVSAIKSFDYPVDEDGPMVKERDVENLFIIVGRAEAYGGAGESSHQIKAEVEDYFRDPRNIARINLLALRPVDSNVH